MNHSKILNNLINRIHESGRSYPNCHAKHQNDVFASTYPATLKFSGVTKYFFRCKTSYIGTIGNTTTSKGLLLYHNNSIRPNRIYYSQDNKILYFFPHVALQTAPVISTTEPSSSVSGSSDRHAQLLTVGNFEIIWNLNEDLVRIMRCDICYRT